MALDILRIRKDFPILKTTIGCNRLVYLDNAATTHKPKVVVEAISQYYYKYNANAFRSGHFLAKRSTTLYEEAKQNVLRFFGASNHTYAVIFTRNATEALNLAVWIVLRLRANKFIDDERDTALLSYFEHNSNYLPWRRLEAAGMDIGFFGINRQTYTVDSNEVRNVFKETGKRVAVVSMAWVSNVLGVVNDIGDITELAHRYGALVVVDAAQSAAHVRADIEEQGIDMLAFSGHKMYGPMGIGGLIIRKELLECVDLPFVTGGGVVSYVSTNKASYIDGEEKLIAGTPNVADAVGLSAAIDYLSDIGLDEVLAHEDELVQYTLEQLARVIRKYPDRIDYLGNLGVGEDSEQILARKTGVFSFVIKGADINDAVRFFDEEGVALRGGKHCAHLLHRYLGVSNTLRISLAMYNSFEDIDIFVDVLEAYLHTL